MDSFNQQVSQITIVGTGLLGASLGLGLEAAGFTGKIIGLGRRQATVERARELGCVHEATTEWGPAVAGSQLLVLATPLGAFADLLGRLAEHDHDGLVMTDVGSVKQQVCSDAVRILPEPGRFVGSHPMAGSELHGPDNAFRGLFVGCPCVITPQQHTGAEALALVKMLWTIMGMNLLQMSPAEHDRKTAYISHLPHALATQLVRMAARNDALDVASSGFRDTSRVASGDPYVWQQILAANRGEMISALDAFAQELVGLRELLDNHEDQKVLEQLQSGKHERDAWLSRTGGSCP